MGEIVTTRRYQIQTTVPWETIMMPIAPIPPEQSSSGFPSAVLVYARHRPILVIALGLCR